MKTISPHRYLGFSAAAVEGAPPYDRPDPTSAARLKEQIPYGKQNARKCAIKRREHVGTWLDLDG